MSTTDIPFQHIVIDKDNPPDPHCKAAGDIDGDGYPDLLAASASGGGLFWYRYPNWSKHKIADGTFTTDMEVGDIDGDGHLDVVIPSNAGLMCFRNPKGTEEYPITEPWEAINISPNGARMHDVELADLDGDGKLDIVTRHQSGFGRMLGNQIHIWKQESPTVWHHRTFACPHGEGLKVADINGDGLPDITIGGRWYENPGNILEDTWNEHLFIPPEDFERHWTKGDVMVDTGDLNGDGRVDIVLTPSEGTGRLSWFEAPQKPTDSNWIEHVIEPQIDHTHALAVGDIDCDGHLDIVVAKMHQAIPPQGVYVYRNLGKGKIWAKGAVSTTGSHNIVLVDIGSDGRLDIFGANWNNKSLTHGAIELWLNQA